MTDGDTPMERLVDPRAVRVALGPDVRPRRCRADHASSRRPSRSVPSPRVTGTGVLGGVATAPDEIRTVGDPDDGLAVVDGEPGMFRLARVGGIHATLIHGSGPGSIAEPGTRTQVRHPPRGGTGRAGTPVGRRAPRGHRGRLASRGRGGVRAPGVPPRSGEPRPRDVRPGRADRGPCHHPGRRGRRVGRRRRCGRGRTAAPGRWRR